MQTQEISYNRRESGLGERVIHLSSASGASSGRQTLLLGLLLAVATMVLYLPVRSHPFTNYDDSLYVTDNVQVQSGLTWDTVVWSMTTFRVGTWHPVTWLSHALDCQLFELNPAGPHLVNAAAARAERAAAVPGVARATGSPWRSLMVAALFALHPINVESVAWIAERKNVLSMLFFLLALGAYRWYAEKPARPRLRYAVVAVFFALGLMAKPQVITLPFVLLLWDYWPLRRMLADPNDSSARYPAAQDSTSSSERNIRCSPLPPPAPSSP